MSDHMLIALIPIASVDGMDFGWVTDDGNPWWRTVDPIDVPLATLQRLYNLYRMSYQRVGDRSVRSGGGDDFLPSPDALLKYTRMFWLCAGDVLPGALPDARDIVGHVLCRALKQGMKLGILGSDKNLSRDARRAVSTATVTLTTRILCVDGVFGEVSPPLEDRLTGRVPAVPFAEAERVLRELNKTDVQRARDDHYTRHIRGVGLVTKVMVGKPRP